MLAAGIAIVLLQIVPAALPGLAIPLAITAPERTPLPTRPPAAAPDIPVIWRDFRPGERAAGPSDSVRLCAAALQRGGDRSALVLRFCGSQPITPQRRFAFGYEDLRIRALLPGGAVLAYDLLDYEPTATGGSGFRESALPDNSASLEGVGVRNVTDLVFVFRGEVPLGLPTIELSARYAGADVAERRAFEPLGADLARAERERVRLAPDWASTRY